MVAGVEAVTGYLLLPIGSSNRCWDVWCYMLDSNLRRIGTNTSSPGGQEQRESVHVVLKPAVIAFEKSNRHGGAWWQMIRSTPRLYHML